MPFTPAPCPCGPGDTPGPGLDCDPVPMCPQFAGLSGPEVWSLPAGVESFTIDVVCGPITITDCQGEVTVVNECGSLSYAAPSLGCTPGAFCTPFTLTVPADSAAYVKFLTPCGG